MKKHLLTLLLTCVPMVAQAADRFTFEQKSEVTDGVRVPAQTEPHEGALIWRTTRDVTFASGQKHQDVGKCATWQTPGGRFARLGVCEFPTFEQRTSCAAPASDGSMECFATLLGTSAPWAGRTGAITYHAGQAGIAGEGHWN
jgi:hypothetical protein